MVRAPYTLVLLLHLLKGKNPDKYTEIRWLLFVRRESVKKKIVP